MYCTRTWASFMGLLRAFSATWPLLPALSACYMGLATGLFPALLPPLSATWPLLPVFSATWAYYYTSLPSATWAFVLPAFSATWALLPALSAICLATGQFYYLSFATSPFCYMGLTTILLLHIGFVLRFFIYGLWFWPSFIYDPLPCRRAWT